MYQIRRQKSPAQRLRELLRARGRRLLAMSLALCLFCGLLWSPVAAEEIHPPASSSQEEAPPIAAPSSTEGVITPADTAPQPGETSPVPSSTNAAEFPVQPETEPTVTEPTEPLVVNDVSRTNSSEEAVSAGTRVSNTYILEVSTGSVRNGGVADNVNYFVIYYSSGAEHRSEVIFPCRDGIRRSVDAASAIANRDSRRQMVADTFGYTTPALRDHVGMHSVKTDQFLFTTPKPISSIDRIQIFGKAMEVMNEDGTTSSLKNDWACQGIRIYDVLDLYGEEMYGWYSEEGYIDFSGEIIADVVMASGGGTFQWNSTGGVFNITPPDVRGGVAGCDLINTQVAATYSRDHNVGRDHFSQAANRVFLRLDLADSGGAGFECLAGSYEAGSHTTVSDLKLCETAAVTVRYEDVYGCLRDVTLPLVINSLGWTMEALGQVEIAGFGQQGTNIALSAMLPDFDSLRSVRMVLGEENAAAKAHLITTEAAAGNALRASRVTASATDEISYLCFAAYASASVNIRQEGAQLRYVFTPGARNPVRYYTAGSSAGLRMAPGKEETLSLNDYHDNLTVSPIDRQERYLITISTDNVDNAGTNADVYLRFTYLNMKDKEVVSDEYRVRDYVRQFYGEWPGNQNDFAYRYGMRAQGTVQLMIPLQNVKQFKSVSIRLDGNDEWQFKGLQIQMVRSYDNRVLRWQEIDDQGLKSHLLVSRAVSAQSVCFAIGQVYSDENPPVPPDDESWQPGTLIQDDHQVHEFNGQSREVDARDEIDWASLRNFMSYEDTLQDLGFDRKRCNYEVQVNVAGDKVNEDDDDCGSANLFYFQLVFDYGNSGCVLANQQLPSDSFRTGTQAKFTIPTAQDYGDLLAIRIIPDDQDSNSNIYDKLKISSITVRKVTTGKISPTWTADSASADGLGWVGIEPRDAGAAVSIRGSEGRSILELSHRYNITKASYSTKLLISITTGAYATTPKTGNNGEEYMLTDPQLVGGMSMSLKYYDHNGKLVTVDPFDIVHAINDYDGLKDSHTRTVDGVSTTVDYCVSSPDYQFRGGKTDNFFVDVDNIASLVEAQLQIRSSVVTYWNINNITVYQLQGPGTRYINSNGEYDYKYPAGQELLYKATWNREENLVKDVQIYRVEDNDSIATVDIAFNENAFEAYDAEGWDSTVTREPASKDDMLNLFIYPSTESAATDPSKYELFADVLYTDTLTHSPQRNSFGSLNLTTDSSGRPCFYALGLNTSYLESISGVDVKTQTIYPVHAPLSYGVIQRIRSGVLIDSYYLISSGNADSGLTMHIANQPSGQNVQRVLMQFTDDMSPQSLIPDEKDLAVALYFTTDDAYGSELRTKYVTLTDQGIQEIKPGQVVELDFSIMNLKEIVGLGLVNMGRLEDSIARAVVLEQLPSGEVTGKWSFRSTMTPARTPLRMDLDGVVTVLDLDIATALSDASLNSGTTGPVRMIVGYLDAQGVARERTYEDIRPYVDSRNAFMAGSTDHLRLLIPDVEELRWLSLEPLNGTDGVTATWKIASVSTMTDLSGLTLTRVLNQIAEAGKPPVRVSLAELLMSGLVSLIRSPEEIGTPSGDYTIPTNNYLDVVLNIGDGLRIVPRLEGSTEDLNVTLNRLDPSTGALGRPDLMDTRGYTAALLEQYAQAAEEKGNTNEAAVWRSVVPDNGTWEVVQSGNPGESPKVDAVVFMPPHNYTGSAISYRITLTSQENPSVSVWVNLSVPAETNPVTELLAAARAQDSAQGGGSHQHTITYTPRLEPTCIQAGHEEYYSCAGCQKYFSDALGKTEIPDVEILTLAALGHSWGEWSPVKDKEGKKDTGYHTRTCLRCGETETASCVYGMSYISDGSSGHHRECPDCHGKTETTDHELSAPTVVNGMNHRECSLCDYTEDTPIPTEPAPTDPTTP